MFSVVVLIFLYSVEGVRCPPSLSYRVRDRCETDQETTHDSTRLGRVTGKETLSLTEHLYLSAHLLDFK